MLCVVKGEGEGDVLRGRRRALSRCCLLLMHFSVDINTCSNAVDIFDASSGRWSTAVLSVARVWLAATSLPNQGLAIFAGGGGL